MFHVFGLSVSNLFRYLEKTLKVLLMAYDLRDENTSTVDKLSGQKLNNIFKRKLL